MAASLEAGGAGEQRLSQSERCTLLAVAGEGAP